MRSQLHTSVSRRTLLLMLLILNALFLSTIPPIHLTNAADHTQQSTARVWLPYAAMHPPFNPSVNGFSFANYGGSQYSGITSVEMRRLFGKNVCSSAVQTDGSCTLTPGGQRWMEETNSYMLFGRCEGMAVLSVLMFNGQLKPQDFGAARVSDLVLEGNTKLQREIAYWFTTTRVQKTATVKRSPNDVLAALRASITRNGSPFGTLRFSKVDHSGAHSVTPISIVERPNNQVAISVYDSNYPGETREITIDTAANTWFYSPEANLIEDNYTGDAQSQTLGFAPIQPRIGTQACPFCQSTPTTTQSLLPAQSSNTSTADSLVWPSDSSHYSGVGVSGNKPMDFEMAPSSNQVLRSWETPAIPHFTVVPTETITFDLFGKGDATTADAWNFDYIGHGYVFEISELRFEPGEKDRVEIADGGTTITYTTGSGSVPELFVGFERPDADFGFSFFDFDMLPTDKVQLQIDTVNNLLDVQIDTVAASGQVVFDFEMSRVNETSAEIFHSPEGGFDLRNGETLLIDYSSWHGGTNPLRVGYDANNNGLLDPDEVFTWEETP